MVWTDTIPLNSLDLYEKISKKLAPMPELPEVEVVCQGLRPLVVGQTFGRVRVSGLALRLPVPHAELKRWLTGARVEEVRRRGKYLVLVLDNRVRLIFHLGMTGRLGLFPAKAPLAPHDHVCLGLNNRMELRYNDTRRFGSVQVLAPDQDEAVFFAALGPEPLLEDFSAPYLTDKAAGRGQAIKGFLMDSRVVVGIGNIYANEILHEAKISPARPTKQVTRAEWQRVVKATRAVLNRAISAGGSTISDFVNAGGKPGYFQLEFKVYGRQGQPCRRCGAAIIKETLGGRATYFCKGCQR
jgi:formamidopyrimidine-DNA glycosylase